MMATHRSTFWIFTILIIIKSSMLSADETKWIAIGSLHNWYSSAGSEIEVGRRGQISDTQDGLRWPAQFKFQDNQTAKGFWIGTTDYDDSLAGALFPYKVVHVGPRGPIREDSEFMPVEFSLHAKFDHPLVLVDGDPASNMSNLDLVDVVNADLPTERMLYTEINTAIGITVIRRIYVSSQQYHDNYHILEYTFKNTGIINLEGAVQRKTLTDVMFFWQYRYSISREGGVYGVLPAWLPQNATWGRNTVNEVIGELPGDNDPFRALYAWHGRHSSWSGPVDNIGAPAYLTDGHLGASQYVGVVTLHADISATDKSNDPNQPGTTKFLDSDDPVTSGNSQFNEAKMRTEYLDFMTAGHPDLTHAELVGGGNANEFGPTAGGYSQGHGFGPYILEFGDSIRIVMAEGAAGISREMGYSVGADWLDWVNGGSGPYELPDGSTTTDGNEHKNAWVYTGVDSLLQTFGRATQNYAAGFEIPQAPPPPDSFAVTSEDGFIQIEWSDNAESWVNFAGYNLYRAIHKPDTMFTLIYSSGAGTQNALTNFFEDRDVDIDTDYYYYLVSLDDGSTNGISPGTPLESSKFYTMTNRGVRNIGVSVDDEYDKLPRHSYLENAFPNPFNSRTTIGYSISKPSTVSLTIYNLMGQEIFQWNDDNLQPGHYEKIWNGTNKLGIPVVSGMYLYRLKAGDFVQTKKMFLLK